MADSTDLVSTFNLSQIDTDHLARQALTLFRKRYSMLYDSHFEVVDIDKKGYVTREEKYEFLMKYTPAESLEKSKELVEKTWLALVGGWKDVLQVNREQVIDLCIRGYHSKDKNHTKYLEELIKTINKYHLDLMDTNHDGIISKEEFISWVQSRGFGDHWQDAFSALDLNGDGKIDRQEFLKCNLGFCFNIDEDRYNHFFGVVKD